MNRFGIATFALIYCLLWGLLTVPAGAQANLGGAPGSCDKACLRLMADAYFAALVAHDPSKVAIAPNAKFTENTQVLKVGDGLWKTASEAPSNFKVYVPDPIAGQLGAIVLMKDAGRPIQLALRIKVVNKQIAEAEHVLARNANEANFGAPSAGLLATVPPAERTPRGLMLVVGHSYYDALEQSDGTVAPFADDCVRRENGTQTGGPRAANVPPPRGGGPGGGAAQTCAAQINSRTFYYINRIDLRRVWIADEETGLVFGMTMFRHPMEEKVFKVYGPDGTLTDRDMSRQNPFDFESVHIFKIQKGQIHDIEALGISLPYHSKNGWSDFIR
jgi:hypothetical protein